MLKKTGNGIKTLYATDLDGTLLRSDATVSEYTRRIIKELASRGVLFTYATARSAETAAIVTAGVIVTAPPVLYNGAMTGGEHSGLQNVKHLGESGKRMIEELIGSGIYPIVYSVINGMEKFSFLPDKLTAGGKDFMQTRLHCVRYNPVHNVQDIFNGDVFYILCIDAADKLLPFYARYKEEYNCVYDKHYYTGSQWLEIMSPKANKAVALTELKNALGAERLVVFGDGKNDIGMFSIADERYAVENANAELKAIATGVIGSNDADGVAKWLEENAL